MKLAFCLFNYFPYGGLQRDFMRFARLCHAQGHEIHVYTMRWDGEKEPAFHLHLIPTHGWQNHTRIKQFVSRVKSDLTDGRYDLVMGFNKMPYLHLYYAADVCYQARLTGMLGLLSYVLPRYRNYLDLEGSVFAKEQTTQIMVLTAAQKGLYQRCYATPDSRFHILSPAITRIYQNETVAAQQRQSIRQAYQLSDSHLLLLMVGSSFKTKGVDRAIKALASLPEVLKKQCRLWVIGKDKPQFYQALAKQLNVSEAVRFLGPRTDVSEFMQAADFLLQPSHHESAGIVILEALSSGLPVLTVAACGYASYVAQADAGIVLPAPFQQTLFNQRLATLIASPREQLRKNALSFSKQADIYDNHPTFLRILYQVAAKHIPVCSDTSFYLQTTIRAYFAKADYFDQLMMTKGEPYRDQPGRLTQRVVWQGKSYFLKQHGGVGWLEIFKNFLQGRSPVLGARNEWVAINRLRQLGVRVAQAVGFGERYSNPAKQQSFILLEDLADRVSLDIHCETWLTQPPTGKHKRSLLRAVAKITQTLHDNGINHRDLYLCHFLLAGESIDHDSPDLALIDLHRAQCRQRVPLRWVIKDLAGLYFSSLDIGLTQRDLLYFVKYYCQGSSRSISLHTLHFWQKVISRGNKQYKKHHGRA